jgi:hypothetical protein
LDQNDRVNPGSLDRLATVLELNVADLFLLAGLPVPNHAPTVEALLRAEYDLPEEAVHEAKSQIDAIVKRYKSTKVSTRKGGKK